MLCIFALFNVSLTVPEAATRGVLRKKVFLHTSRNSQENTCSLRPATLLKKRLWHRYFLRTPLLKKHLWTTVSAVPSQIYFSADDKLVIARQTYAIWQMFPFFSHFAIVSLE